jgi:ATP-dependent Clp protease ATP-binding subunit ClpA
MARVIQEHIKRPLAEDLLFGKLADGGGTARVMLAEDGKDLVLVCRAAREPELIE